MFALMFAGRQPAAWALSDHELFLPALKYARVCFFISLVCLSLLSVGVRQRRVTSPTQLVSCFLDACTVFAHGLERQPAAQALSDMSTLVSVDSNMLAELGIARHPMCFREAASC